MKILSYKTIIVNKKKRYENPKGTIQRNLQHWIHKTKTNNAIGVGHIYTQTNINKTLALLQTTGGKDELNIVFM